MSSPPPRPAGRRDFEIAILCALPVEADAVLELFDEEWDKNSDGRRYDKAEADPNAYTTGVIGRHNVVLAHLGGMGNISSASAAASVRMSFPNIKLGLVVGVLCVVPSSSNEDERVLGDVIISEAVVQYDFGRQYAHQFVRKDTLLDVQGRPNQEIRSLLAKLKNKYYQNRLQEQMAKHLESLQTGDSPKYKYPGKEDDLLFPPRYRHTNNKEVCKICCDGSKKVERARLQPNVANPMPMVHFGIVGSGNSVIKSSEDRFVLATPNGLIGFEMEGSGVWDSLPCVIIKGACDYGDSHKAKVWQPYAAATAAACMKAFLYHWTPSPQSGPPKAIKAGPWHSQLYKNRNFVGRTELINDLTGKRFIGDNHGHRRIALSGLGGVGKTQLALEIAFWVKDNMPGWSVFWIQALSMASFEKSCRDIAKLLSPNGVEQDDAKELVKKHLNSVAAGHWLLVVDNIDDETLSGRREEGIRDFIPRSSQGKVLFTTRYRRIAHQLAQNEIINLEHMNQDEAKKLLSNSLVTKPPEDAEQNVFELLEFLTYLPLAIVQAASYMNVTTASVSQYIHLLRNTPGDMMKLLETEWEDDSRDPKQTHAIVSTWVVSFEQIRKSLGAAKLLSFIAHIEFKAIPPGMVPRMICIVWYISLYEYG
ncbi:hypothetical protein MCOR05_011904 [Pyricularia oryzae]|nr:hypothetical protein MCOR05_011904 [Pyricularia oryzae]